MSFLPSLSSVPLLLLLAAPPAAPASSAGSSLAGDYVCRSMGSGPCDTQTTISLHDDGTWAWRYFSGQYQVSGNSVTFKGTGLGSWGPAVIGTDSLTFSSGGQRVVFQKPSAPSGSLAGNYVCSSSPGGCQTRLAIQIRADGTWAWGAQHGTYTALGHQLKFTGLSSGPAGWGLAAVRNGVLTFQANSGASQWRKRD